MFQHLRFFAILAASLWAGSLLYGLAIAGPDDSPPAAPRSHGLLQDFATIEARANATSIEDDRTVRPLIDSLFARPPFDSAAPSIRDRVLRNEISFRRGGRSAVQEMTLVDALNDESNLIGSLHPTKPPHLRTSPGQVRHFRDFVRRHVPSINRREGAPLSSAVTDEMSPAEVVLVATRLAEQKFLNPEFGVTPEAWEHAVTERKLRNASQPPTHPVGSRPPELRLVADSGAHKFLTLDMSENSPDVVYTVHTLLDRLGFESDRPFIFRSAKACLKTLKPTLRPVLHPSTEGSGGSIR